MESFNIKILEAMDIPEPYEVEFLRDIADKLDLQPLTRCIFTERLSQANLSADWSQIAQSCPPITPDQARKSAWSRDILPKLRDWGFNYENGSKQLWRLAHQWLATTQFSPWLWEKLTGKAQRTQQMGFLEMPDPAPVPHLGARQQPSKPYQDKVRLHGEVILEIKLTEAAHLTLMEREPNGTVVCLCPSEYAPNPRLSKQAEIIPQPSAPYPRFAATELGQEQWIALLTPQSPDFVWLEQSRREALELDSSHLQQVFEYVQQKPQARLLYTEYEVV